MMAAQSPPPAFRTARSANCDVAEKITNVYRWEVKVENPAVFVDLDFFGVKVIWRDIQRAALGKTRGTAALIGNGKYLAKPAGSADGSQIGRRHAHAFEAFEEVDAVLSGLE